MLIKNNEARVSGTGGPPSIVLMPGLNEVPNETWEAAMAIPAVRGNLERRLKSKAWEIVSKDDQELTKMHGRKAKNVIVDTWDINKLKKWRAAETRPKIVEAIDAQIESLFSE